MKFNNIYTYKLFILVYVLLFVSCTNTSKDDEKSLLLKFIETNKIETKPTSSGLYFIPTDTSSFYDSLSLEPKRNDTLVLRYKGYLIDNYIFTDTDTNTVEYIYLNQPAIKGWEEGISLMKKGVSANFIIPSNLAYGKEQIGKIPPYSTLIFEVSIIDIK